MTEELGKVKTGLALVILGLCFGIGLGVSFGVGQGTIRYQIHKAVAAHPEVHDENSEAKIWRYVQRAHMHATGVSAFSLGLIILVMFSDMKARLKTVSSVLIGLGSFYPAAWFTMFAVAPYIGREQAHEFIVTEIFTWIGVGGLLLGLLMLVANLFLGKLRDEHPGS